MIVTVRSSLLDFDQLEYITLKQYLDRIRQCDKIMAALNEIYSRFIAKETFNGSSDEEYEDCVIHAKHMEKQNQEEYRGLKRGLPVVHFFGRFECQGNKMVLQGEGNGLVVLDIDAKELFKMTVDGEGRLVSHISSDFIDLVETEISNYFFEHPSTLFLYKTSTGLNWHLGFLTDAKDEVSYKRALSSWWMI